VVRNEARLVDHAGTDRAGVDLDQADDVGVEPPEERSDAIQDLAVTAQVSSPGNRQVKGWTRAGCVADIVKDQAHVHSRRASNLVF
jgi:hypothetical protein